MNHPERHSARRSRIGRIGAIRRRPAAVVRATAFMLATGLSLTAGPVAGAARQPSLDRAHDAQREFERLRRRHYRRDAWGDGRCHEHLGRLCLVHGRDEGWERPPDAPDVIEGRSRLLAVLDSLAGRGDPWVSGQRVKYLLEAGDTARAETAADLCEAGWQCDALRAFVAHVRGRALPAEALFGRALQTMPPAERCAWEDLTMLLEREDRAAYARLPCDTDGRSAFADRFWHLGDPLWSREGHERRMEHYARQVWSLLHAGSASGYGLPWGDDLREVTVRYGWPDGWDLAWRRVPGVRTERAVEAHRSAHAQQFVPRGLASNEPEWKLDDDRPRSEWAPLAGPVNPPPDAQVAAFRRGDRRVFVAALDSGEAPCEGDVALMLSSGRDILAGSTGPGGLLVAEPAPGRASFLAVEQVCEDGALRLRAPTPESGKWLSDLLLLHPTDDLPGTLDATLPHVRRGVHARPGEELVVYWEWYGPTEPADVTLTISREDRSVWRKALEFVGLADRGIETSGVRWSDAGSDAGVPRAMEMTLPELPDGTYRVTLQVQTARFGSVSSVREILVGQ